METGGKSVEKTWTHRKTRIFPFDTYFDSLRFPPAAMTCVRSSTKTYGCGRFIFLCIF